MKEWSGVAPGWVVLEERPTESEGAARHVASWVMRFLGREKSKSKGSETKMCLAGLRDSKEASGAGEELEGRRMVGV